MKSLLLVLQFLTRFPIPVSVEYSPERLARGTVWFPFAGLLIGAVYCAVYYIAGLMLPDFAQGALLVFVGLKMTGGLHLDGYMDTADGLGSCRDRERMLEIMKDSRVGAMGAIAGAMHLIMKFALFASLSWGGWGVLIGMPVMARFAMVLAICRYPYVRSNGLGTPFSENKSAMWLTVSFISMLVFMILFTGKLALVLIPAGILYALFYCGMITKKLGGMTGDTYGALCESSEAVILLLGVFLLHNYPEIFSQWWLTSLQ